MSENSVVGVVAVVVGLVLCLRGYSLIRALLALAGAVAGFTLGAQAGASIAGTGLFDGVLSWVGALVGALALGSVAYLFYAVAVVLGMAVLGYVAALAALEAFGVRTSWLVLGIGLVAGLGLGVAAAAGRLPALLLVLATAVSGAGSAVSGVMLLAGATDLAGVESGTAVAHGGWAIGYLAMALVGAVVQVRRLRRHSTGVHEQWSAAVPG